jgi:hypothetical protein
MRPLHACAIACLSVVAAGCGSASRPPVHVRLQLSDPLDGTRVTNSSIVVSGDVSPAGATVMVTGRSVPVTRGSFTTRVPLRPGTNLVDVLAGAAHAQAAMTAVRVYRQVYISIPDLSGDSPDSAARTLHGLGLVAKIQNRSAFFDFLLPSAPQVCGTSPGAGHSVLPASVVTVTVSKSC